ncbi:MAG: exodeoxyribonuclease VII small subunit [Clostridia bacterium]|nr:exodeoxyribonuclease VII small subunit [Clostridia bacterium]
MAEKVTFENALKRLEEIAEKLENPAEELDNAVKLYEEGVKLAAICNKYIDEAEQKITILSKSGEQNFVPEEE